MDSVELNSEKTGIQLSLSLIISFFLHLVMAVALVLPDFSGFSALLDMQKGGSGGEKTGLRDVIVNINQNNKRDIKKRTLLSNKDSTERGYITVKKGDRWLNNSLDFDLLKGQGKSKGRKGGKKKIRAKKEKFIISSDSEVVAVLKKFVPRKMQRESSGTKIKIKIPDKNNVTMNNAIYYSNSGDFSFNTAKFKNFKYFIGMKNKISRNWHIPVMANVAFGGYNPVTGNYSTARGYERYIAIPSQRIKIVFTMNRRGDVLDVKILDSRGNRLLDKSCVEAITKSRNFGPVPEDIKGDVVVIPFIFGFYTR